MKKILILMLLFCLVPISVYAEEVEVKLSECVDGDTAKFIYENGDIFTYRFLGIDTPETVHPTKGEEPYGKEASNYTCDRLTNAKKIVLEHDEKADDTDKYGRKLAWVFVDDSLLQQELIERGLAEVAYLYDDYKYNDLIKDAEEVARAGKVGIWSVEEDDVVTSNEVENVITSVVEKEKESFIDKIINSIVDKLVASINDLIDSILEKIESLI